MQRRVIRLGLFTLMLGIIGVLIISVAVYELVARAAPDCALLPSAQHNTPPDVIGTGTAFENVTFPATVDAGDALLTIHAFFIPAQDRAEHDAATIIIVHGIGSCRRDPTMLQAAGMLHEAGFNTLVIDLRNLGDSDSDNGRMGAGGKEYRDVVGAVTYLIDERGLDAGRIGVMGFSMGGATAIIAAGEDARISAVWADSAFADMDIVMDYLLGQVSLSILKSPILLLAQLLYGETPTRTDPVSYAPMLTQTPIFLVHSERDRMVIFDNYTVLATAFDAHAVPYEAWITQSAHVATITDAREDYARRLTDFFASALNMLD